MSHLTSARIAAHLAGTDAEASAHVRECDQCARAVAATELMANATLGPEAQPDGPSPMESIEVGAQRLESPAVSTVKALLRAETVASEQDPRRGLELSNRALVVAQTLIGDATMIQLLRARIWRQRAATLRLLGEYKDGLAALDIAERELDGVLVRAYEDAQIAYVRAGILWKSGIDEARARELANEAAAVFVEHGDSLRAIHSRILIAGIDFVQRNYAAARAALTTALSEAVAMGDAGTIAHLHQNIAACAQEQDDLAVAAMHYSSALALFAHLEMKVEELRAEWNRGLLSIRMGHTRDGRVRLRRASSGFLSHGNASDAALVTLDLVEHLASTGEQAQALTELQRVARAEVPPYVRLQMDVVVRALKRGELLPAVRDVRLALLAPMP